MRKGFLKVKKSSEIINKILGRKNIKMPSMYYYKLGRFYVEEGKYKEAIAQIEKAIKLKPQDIEYYLEASNISLKLKNYNRSLGYLEKALRLVPGNVSILCKKGNVEGLSGNIRKAIETFKNIIKSKPKCARKCFSIYYNLGLAYYNIKDYLLAIKYFDKALTFKTQNKQLWEVEAWIFKGESLGTLGKNKEALDCFNKALKINPTNIDALTDKAKTLNILSEHGLAVRIIDKALSLKPNDRNALILKSYMLDELKRYKEALKYINKAIKLNPKDDETLTNKGSILCGLNRHKEEINCYRKALRLNPKNYTAWTNYGNELMRKGNFKEGIKCIDRALKINPQYEPLSALKSKATAFVMLKQYKKSVSYLEKIVQIEKKDADNYYNLACAYSLSNRTNDSLEMLKKALRLDKRNKIIAKKDKDFKNIQNNKIFKRLIS